MGEGRSQGPLPLPQFGEMIAVEMAAHPSAGATPTGQLTSVPHPAVPRRVLVQVLLVSEAACTIAEVLGTGP